MGRFVVGSFSASVAFDSIETIVCYVAKRAIGTPLFESHIRKRRMHPPDPNLCLPVKKRSGHAEDVAPMPQPTKIHSVTSDSTLDVTTDKNCPVDATDWMTEVPGCRQLLYRSADAMQKLG